MEPTTIDEELTVFLEEPDATAPRRATERSVGYDLGSMERKTLPAQGWSVIDTGISIELPPGTYGRIASRSGLAAQSGITVGGGVVDPDYTGKLGVILFNHSANDFEVMPGDRVAQLIIERVAMPPVVVRAGGRSGEKDDAKMGKEEPDSINNKTEIVTINNSNNDDEDDEEEGPSEPPKRARGANGLGSTGI